MTRDWERMTQVLGISLILTYAHTYVLTHLKVETTNLFLYLHDTYSSKSKVYKLLRLNSAIFFSKISTDVIIIPTVPFVPTHGPTLGLSYISRR